MKNAQGRKSVANGFDFSHGLEGLDADEAAVVRRRQKVLGTMGPLFYNRPLHVVSGSGVHLRGADGADYLDCYNNVACVGHSNPHVRQAVADQLGRQNTHSRYLQDEVLDYAERLLATFPGAIDHVAFTNSGSESNDLALRMARVATGHMGVVVTQGAYHGITSLVSSVSPSFGTGLPLAPFLATVRVDDALHDADGSGDGTGDGADGAAASDAAADAVWAVLGPRFNQAFDALEHGGYGVSCVLIDEVMSSDGILPGARGWIERLADAVHARGGLLISDEVQAGFGRMGGVMWGFQRHGAEADIVTMGKPMGNGIPVGGVAYRHPIGDAFAACTRYFNTFGGNPVSMRAAGAVLDEIERLGLVAHARDMGDRLARDLSEILEGHERFGGLRHAGLFLGIDVTDGADDGGAAQPDGAAARAIVNALRDDEHVLISAAGPGDAVLKVRPPLVFDDSDADRLLEAVRHICERGLFDR